MGEAELQRRLRVVLARGPVHRLQEEMGEPQPLVPARLRARLRVDQLELVSAGGQQRRTGLGTHAQPVDARGRHDRPVGLDRHLEADVVQRADQRSLQLEQRLAAGADDQAPPRRIGGRPERRDRRSQRLGGCEPASARSVGADELGIAEPTGGVGAVGLPARPEVASREAAEDGGPAGVGALALQGVEDFLDRVRHACGAWYLAGSGTPASAKPFNRSRHASQ